jgi:hypothetical protein
MIQSQSLIKQQRSTTQQAMLPERAAESRAEGLLVRAREEQSAQDNLVDAQGIGSQYHAALAMLVDAKRGQAERIEERLENLVELQASLMQRSRLEPPGFLSFPGTKARWQRQLLQEQATLQRLQGRLETVREIRDGMGLHGPRLEELATRKLRHTAPELAEAWDAMQEQLRRRLAMGRTAESVMHQQANGTGTRAGLSNTLAIRPKA